MNKGVNIIVPLAGIKINCGRCGFLGWEINVLPQGEQARIRFVRCRRCSNTLFINPEGMIDGQGKALGASVKPLTQEDIDAGNHGN